MIEADFDYSDYESGPFCRHWDEAGYCPIKCAACGHTCGRHEDAMDSTECNECDCPAWVEPDDTITLKARAEAAFGSSDS